MVVSRVINLVEVGFEFLTLLKAFLEFVIAENGDFLSSQNCKVPIIQVEDDSLHEFDRPPGFAYLKFWDYEGRIIIFNVLL